MANIPSDPIIVVGAGWAGLACAFTLAKQGKAVMLLEVAPQAGGRARGIPFGKDTVDNGQHLFIGAYHHTLQLLKDLNIQERSVFHRTPLELCMLDLNNPLQPFHLKLPNLPFPLQWFTGLLKAKGFSLEERLKAIHFFRAINAPGFSLLKDISIKELLYIFKQPPSLITKIWEPIALAALSTPIHKASAQIFLKILKDTFSKNNKNSNWLFPKVNLTELIPDPIIKYLTKNQSLILYHQRVQRLWIENGQCKGVLTDTAQFKGKHVILATPPHITAQLLKSDLPAVAHCQAFINKLEKFQYQPITTVYLRYPNAIQLKSANMVGLIQSTGHWIFNRRMAGQPEILSVVLTGVGPHNYLTHPALVEKLVKEIGTVIPMLKIPPLDFRVICEKRAAFSCEVGIAHYRPSPATPILNLWLAGDYTETQYPATLEGAVLSGIKAANLILLKERE